MVDARSKILIIEDDLDVAEMLKLFFRAQGYEVFIANWGEDGVRAVSTNRPDLIILDIRLPDIDGYEVARRLRSDRKTESIPIIFLTEKRDRADRLQGLELGADDYITKPFDVQELRLRARNAIIRASQGTLTNPVTGLPEGEVVLERLNECLNKNNWALVLVSLHNLDVFRKQFGLVASDDVMRAISLMLHNVLREAGTPENFIGHLSPTDILLMTEPGSARLIDDRARTRLEKSLNNFYPFINNDQAIKPGARLVVQSSHLTAGERRFTSAEEIKTELNLRKK